MKHVKILLYIILILLPLVVLYCSSSKDAREKNKKVPVEESDERKDQAKLEKMKAEILKMTEDKTCNRDGDCRDIGFGSKPCGGPWRFLVYSISTVDTVELAGKMKKHNDFENYMNEKYGYVSDCMVPLAPPLGCVDGKCTTK